MPSGPDYSGDLMKIFSITQDDKYKTLVDLDHASGLQDFATKLAYGEVTVDEKSEEYQLVFNVDDKKKKGLSDFYTYFRPVLVVSRRAYLECGRLESFPRLPIASPHPDDVALFVSDLVSGIFDFENSDYDKGDTGYVVYKTVLKVPKTFDSQIFRIPENPQAVYVSEVFKTEVEARGLVGLKFQMVEVFINS